MWLQPQRIKDVFQPRGKLHHQLRFIEDCILQVIKKVKRRLLRNEVPFKGCDLRRCAAFAAVSTFLGGKWIRISNFCPTCYCLRSIIWTDKKIIGANSESLTFD